jgi:F-type H+-transporting ATPase subunit epsilon
MHLNIITHNKKIFEGTIHTITLPGINGSFQVLPGHAPLITTLTSGQVVYTHESEKSELPIDEGIVSVHDNQVTLLVETSIS